MERELYRELEKRYAEKVKEFADSLYKECLGYISERFNTQDIYVSLYDKNDKPVLQYIHPDSIYCKENFLEINFHTNPVDGFYEVYGIKLFTMDDVLLYTNKFKNYVVISKDVRLDCNIRIFLRDKNYKPLNAYNSKRYVVDINADNVRKLREETGDGLMDCKKALCYAEGDWEEAKLYLKYNTRDKRIW